MKLKAIAALLALAAGAASAQTVAVTDAWARPSVPGQTTSGAFMTLTAKSGAKLVAVLTPVAGVAEVHEMKMEGDVMKMRAVHGGLDLPAGKAVVLKPGGYHIMLMNLTLPLTKNTTIPMTLVFKDAKGAQSKTELKVPVSMTQPGDTAPMAMPADAHSH